MLFADGHVGFISTAKDPEVIEAALTRDGGKDGSELGD